MNNGDLIVSKESLKYYLIICLIYIFSQNCLYLFSENNIFIFISLILVFILWILGFDSSIKFNFISFLYLFPIILSLQAAIIEKINFPSASVLYSFFNQIKWWGYSLIFFPVFKLLKKGKIDSGKLINMMIVLAEIQILIGVFQFFVDDYIIFVHCPLGIRNGNIRYYYPIILMCFSLFYHINRLFSKNIIFKKRILSIIWIILAFIEIVIVQQFRSTLMGIIVSIILSFLIGNNKISKKNFIFLNILIILVFIFLNTNIFNEIKNSIFYNNDNSLGMRNKLINFMLNSIKGSYFFGRGWMASKEAYNYLASSYYVADGYFSFADGGIISLYYSYGILGIIWVLIIWFKLLYNGIFFLRKKENYLYLMYPLYMLISIYIDIHWYIHNQFFIFSLFVALSEYNFLIEKKQLKFSLCINKNM